MGFDFIMIVPLLPSHCSFFLVFGHGIKCDWKGLPSSGTKQMAQEKIFASAHEFRDIGVFRLAQTFVLEL